MQTPSSHAAIGIFAFTVACTFVASWLGRRHTRPSAGHGLSDQGLNRWLVGLSAGAASTSGFVITGLVGMGYVLGVHALLFTFGWLIGDLFFWWIFPQRINRVARETSAATLTDIVTHGLTPRSRAITKRLVGLLVLACLGGYVSAQWLAGEIFLQGAFGFGALTSLLSFAALIIVYTALGGFRGSIYTDSLQAVIRGVATAVVLTALFLIARNHQHSFWTNIAHAGPTFLALAPSGAWLTATFMLGWAVGAFGFDLGEPHIVTRFMAGDSPAETQAAWWIFIGFVQYTQISMILFGVFLRGLLPHIPDPESGLSVFFHTYAGPVLTGIVVADIFTTIAATSNSILVTMAQTAAYDLLLRPSQDQDPKILWPATVVAGLATMVFATTLQPRIASIVLTVISLMASGLAPAMLARVLHWKRTGLSVIASVLTGVAAALCWIQVGLSGYMNEALPGILCGVLVERLIASADSRMKATKANHSATQPHL